MYSGIDDDVIFSTGEDDRESTASGASDSEDDFVVVIPDCFNLDVPLTTCPSHDITTQSCDEFEFMNGSHDQFAGPDDIMTQSHDSVVVHTPPTTDSRPTVPIPVLYRDPAPHPNPQSQTTADEPKTNPPTSAGTSPRTGRRLFVPERVKLRDVKDARLTNPLTVATGLVNTVADLVEGLTISGKKRGSTEKDGLEDVANKKEEVPRNQPTPEEEEEFVVSITLILNLCYVWYIEFTYMYYTMYKFIVQVSSIIGLGGTGF